MQVNRLTPGVAQCFHAADHIVVLKDHEILDQGNWQIFQFKAAFSTKFSSSSSNNYNAILAASFEKLNNQLRTRDETEIDLARKTGDPTLYGEFRISSTRLYEQRLIERAGYYFGYIGFRNLLVLVGCTMSYSFFITFPQYWLQLWTDDGSRDLFYACGFLFLSIMSWASTSTLMWYVSVISVFSRILLLITAHY